MTAADVKYSYDYIRDPRTARRARATSPRSRRSTRSTTTRSRFDLVDAQRRAADDAHQQVRRRRPGGLLRRSGRQAPHEPGERRHRAVQAAGSFQPNSFLTLERHADYWQEGPPYLDEIIFLFIPNSASLLVALAHEPASISPSSSRPQDAEQLAGRRQPDRQALRRPSIRRASISTTNYGPLGDQLGCARRSRSRSTRKRSSGGDRRLRPGDRHHGRGHAGDLGPAARRGADPGAGHRTGQGAARRGRPRGRSRPRSGHHHRLRLDGPGCGDARRAAWQRRHRPQHHRVDLGVWIQNFRSRNMGFTFNDWGTQPDPSLLYYRHFRAQPEGADFRNWNNEEASALLDRGLAEPDFDKRRANLSWSSRSILAERCPPSCCSAPTRDGAAASGCGTIHAASDRLVFRLVETWLETERQCPASGLRHGHAIAMRLPDAVAGGAAHGLLSSIAVFLLVRAVPGDIVARCSARPGGDPAAEAACAAFFGLDRPLARQYLTGSARCLAGRPRPELEPGPPGDERSSGARSWSRSSSAFSPCCSRPVGVPLGLLAGIYEERAARQRDPDLQSPGPVGARVLGRAHAAGWRPRPGSTGRRPSATRAPSQTPSVNLAILLLPVLSLGLLQAAAYGQFDRQMRGRGPGPGLRAHRRSPRGCRRGASSSSTSCATS